MARSDFNYIPIGEEFNASNSSVTKSFAVETGSLEFMPPVDDGYVLLTTRDVTSSGHQLSINGKQLPGFDLRPHEGWATSMDNIPAGYLKPGQNTLTVERIGNDHFAVGAAVVHWREA